MLINKVPTGSVIELHCSAEGKEPITFETEASVGSTSRDKKPLLYCKPITVNGKLVNLKGLTIEVYVSNRGDHRRYYFKVTEACNVKNPKQEGSLLLLTSVDDSRPLNYRRAPRLKYVTDCTICTDKGDVTTGRLHDISSCGLAFVTSRNVVDKGATITLSFKVSESSMSYKVQATVVRLQEVSSSEVLVGCDLNDYYPNLVAFCNHLKSSQNTAK